MPDERAYPDLIQVRQAFEDEIRAATPPPEQALATARAIREAHAAEDRAMLFGGPVPRTTIPAPFRDEHAALYADQQVAPVTTVRMRRGADGHLYRADAAPADPPAPVAAGPVTPPTRTEEENMPDDDDLTQVMPAGWLEVRIVMPPNCDIHAVVDSLVAAYRDPANEDGAVEYSDWVEVRADDGALASIGPCPAPAPA